jgi:hypothetical protein
VGCVLCGELGTPSHSASPRSVCATTSRSSTPASRAAPATTSRVAWESLPALEFTRMMSQSVSRGVAAGVTVGSASRVRRRGSRAHRWRYRKSAHGFSGVLIALTVRWCRCGGGGGTRRWRLHHAAVAGVGEFIGRVGVCGLGGGELEPGAFGVVGERPDRAGAAGVDAGVAVLRAIDDEAVLSASRELVRRVGDRDGGGHDAALDVAVAEVRVLMRSGRKPDQWCRD